MLLAAVVLGTGPVSISAAVPRTRERHAAVQPQRYPVPLNDVRITGGPFLHAQEMDRRWLDAMDPDRYLSGFRSEAGLEPKAPRYGGWESAGCSGHGFGHFLSIHYHVRSEGQIVKKAVYIAIGIDLDGHKDVLGMWVGENESAKFWATVLNSLKIGASRIFSLPVRII